MQNIVTVHLCVKGTKDEARNETIRRLNEWYTDPKYNVARHEAYPPRTLLHYTVGDVKVVSK